MKKEYTIILDAGHGKSTPGKCSPVLDDETQLFEWDFNRDISFRLKEELDKEGIKCIQANTDDVDTKLSKRAERINKIISEEKCEGRSCLMISIHGNASGNGGWQKARGWEVWTTEATNNSDNFAQCFVHVFDTIMPEMKLRGHKEKDFTILYKTNCPCVLTENFFYDNIDDCKFMLSDEGSRKIVDLHVAAIKKYIEENA